MKAYRGITYRRAMALANAWRDLASIRKKGDPIRNIYRACAKDLESFLEEQPHNQPVEPTAALLSAVKELEKYLQAAAHLNVIQEDTK